MRVDQGLEAYGKTRVRRRDHILDPEFAKLGLEPDLPDDRPELARAGERRARGDGSAATRHHVLWHGSAPINCAPCRSSAGRRLSGSSGHTPRYQMQQTHGERLLGTGRLHLNLASRLRRLPKPAARHQTQRVRLLGN